MIVIVDTREKSSCVIDYLDSVGIPWKRQKLDYGDYGLFDNDRGVLLHFTIERKKDLLEISNNLSNMRSGKGTLYQRFCRELARSEGNMEVMVMQSLDAPMVQLRYGTVDGLRKRAKATSDKYNVKFSWGCTAADIVNRLFEMNGRVPAPNNKEMTA